MASKVVFYTDQDSNIVRPSNEICEAIREYLGVVEIMFLHAFSSYGFQSGHNWDKLAERNVIAVVLYDVNDACVFGISLEAGQNAGMEVFEIFGDELFEISNLTITGKKSVLNLKPAQPVPVADEVSDEAWTGAERNRP